MKVFRRPLYTPGSYVKLIELKDEFCKYARGDRRHDRLVSLAQSVVKNRTNYPLRCPVPPVSPNIYVFLIIYFDI